VSRQKTRERQNIVVPARPLRETGVPTLTMHAARAPVLRPLGAAPARKRHAARASRTLRGRALVAAASESEETTTIITNNDPRPDTLIPIRPRWCGERRSLRTFDDHRPTASVEETASGDLLYRFADVDSRTGALAFTSRDGVDVYALGATARIAEETNPVGPSEDAALRLATKMRCVLYTGPHTTAFAW